MLTIARFHLLSPTPSQKKEKDKEKEKKKPPQSPSRAMTIITSN